MSSNAPFRRVITGHNEAGKAVILDDNPPPRMKRVGGGTGPMFYEVWATNQTPVKITATEPEPEEGGDIMLAPPTHGTRIRVLDIPPEDGSLDNMTAEEAKAHFEEIGAGDAAIHDGTANSRHAYMHRTETVDYGIVLEGEITLIMDEGETTVKAGDIVIQRGTNHGWANRSGKNCRIAFILIDGKFNASLK